MASPRPVRPPPTGAGPAASVRASSRDGAPATMQLTAGRPARLRPIAAVLALLAATGLLFDGLNTMFGNGLICLVGAGMLVILLVIAPPPLRFWRRAWPVLALAAAAAGWAALVFVDGGRFAIDGAPVAPDLAVQTEASVAARNERIDMLLSPGKFA